MYLKHGVVTVEMHIDKCPMHSWSGMLLQTCIYKLYNYEFMTCIHKSIAHIAVERATKGNIIECLNLPYG